MFVTLSCVASLWPHLKACWNSETLSPCLQSLATCCTVLWFACGVVSSSLQEIHDSLSLFLHHRQQQRYSVGRRRGMVGRRGTLEDGDEGGMCEWITFVNSYQHCVVMTPSKVAWSTAHLLVLPLNVSTCGCLLQVYAYNVHAIH